MKSIRPILLAEDNPADSELTLDALRTGHLVNEIVAVPDGAQALDFLYRRGAFAGRTTPQPALLLLDLKMPKVDGLEVLRTVRADPALRQLAVVILTSSHEEQDIVRSYELGINAYVVKPVNFDDLHQAVRQLGFFWALLNEPSPALA